MRIRLFVLGVTVLIVGFLSGIAYSLAVIPERTETRAGVSPLDAAVLERLTDLNLRVQTQQGESKAQYLALLRSFSSRRGEVGAGTTNPAPRATTPATTTTVTPAAGAAKPNQLAPLKGWDDGAALRLKETSASLDEVKRLLGPPDRVSVAKAGDTMTYCRKDGETVVATMRISLAGGRVTDVVLDASR